MVFFPALGLSLIFGLTWGLAFFSAASVLAGAYHLRNLMRLVKWSREPLGTPLPRAMGVWDYAFADLSRRARVGYDQRDRLSATLERFREASQAMPDGVLYLSESNAINWINRRAEEHFGLDHGRDLGAPVTNLVRQPDFVHYLEAGNYAEPLLMRSTRNAGHSLVVQVVPYAEDEKMVLSRDVTQLERLETVRRDFVANVSHELRTPLTVVIGFLEILEDDVDELSREERLKYLKMASEQATRMHRLIQDLLALSALETEAPAAVEERVDLSLLLEEIRGEAVALSAGRHRISLECHGPSTVLGSAKELHSAFANLATNAVRYTPDGGHIEMRWQCDGGDGVFSVSDDGIGIDAADIPRLTERFYRVDRGRSRESGGTGLGLAIVKHVLPRHQGELHITSVTGQGSTFSATIPRRRIIALSAVA